MSYLIKDLPMDEKPREKAKKYGISSFIYPKQPKSLL